MERPTADAPDAQTGRQAARQPGRQTGRHGPVRRRVDTAAMRRKRMLSASIRAVVVALGVLVCLVVSIQVRAALKRSELFEIRAIEVRGVERVRPWELQVVGELAVGQNLLSVDEGETTGKLERHPWIKEVALRRCFPNRIILDVREREPAAILSYGELYYVDEDGEVFKKVKPGDRLNLPILTGLDKPGHLQKGAIGRQAIRESLALIQKVAEKTRFQPDQISEVHLDENAGYSIYTANAVAKIHLGWDAFDLKLERLMKLLEQERLDLGQVRQIDLDLTRWAVVTPLQP